MLHTRQGLVVEMVSFLAAPWHETSNVANVPFWRLLVCETTWQLCGEGVSWVWQSQKMIASFPTNEVHIPNVVFKFILSRDLEFFCLKVWIKLVAVWQLVLLLWQHYTSYRESPLRGYLRQLWARGLSLEVKVMYVQEICIWTHIVILSRLSRCTALQGHAVENQEDIADVRGKI